MEKENVMMRKRWNYKMERNGSVYPMGGKKERKNVRWMTRKRWNNVERKVMETCILRAETNGKEKGKGG